MKRVITFLFICLLGFSATLQAEVTIKTLNKYEKLEDGTYGYGETPMPYYPGSSDIVQVSDTFELNKFEFRGMWAATIVNLDIKNTTTKEEYQAEFAKILDNLERFHMNALIFQVRPSLDTFYPSQINPWSEFVTGQMIDGKVTGKQGTDPGWDPLAWMIEATHARGIEFHAWFNPYRVTPSPYTSSTAIQNKLGKTAAELNLMSIEEVIALYNEKELFTDNNYAVLNPSNVLRFNGKLFLDPGVPAVQDYVTESIKEVADNYDVDAIHFDDYFYPYKEAILFGEANEDRHTFLEYGVNNGYEDSVTGIEEWRRDNVTNLMNKIHTVTQNINATENRAIQFGISPFGIWEHKGNNPLGSNTPTSSSQTYSGQTFADTYKWIKEGTIDYIAPQIYWAFGTGAAPYGELARWWDNVVEGTNVHLYIGHANYKHEANSLSDLYRTSDWMNPEEVPNQLKFNQQYSNIKGSLMYGNKDMIKKDMSTLPSNADPKTIENFEAKNTMIDKVRVMYLQSKPLVPAKTNVDSIKPLDPTEVITQEGGTLTWKGSASPDERYYVIYRQAKASFKNVESMTNDVTNIYDKVWTKADKNFTYPIASTYADEEFVYALSAFDRANNESNPVLFTPFSGGGVDPSDFKPTTPTKPNKNNTQSNASTAPSTGDESKVGMLKLLLATAMITLGGYTVVKKHSKEE